MCGPQESQGGENVKSKVATKNGYDGMMAKFL